MAESTCSVRCYMSNRGTNVFRVEDRSKVTCFGAGLHHHDVHYQ